MASLVAAKIPEELMTMAENQYLTAKSLGLTLGGVSADRASLINVDSPYYSSQTLLPNPTLQWVSVKSNTKGFDTCGFLKRRE